MTVVALEGVTAGYGGAPAVRDVSFTVEAGEVVALLGANGAGKTTTLAAISGLIAPLRGTVTVLGERVSSSRPYRVAKRGLAHVPEDRGLFFALTVDENLRLGTTVPRAERAASRRRALSFFPALEPLLGRRAGVLSGGEQQMLAMARALASAPSVLLVDEMSLGLAPVIVESLLPRVREIAHETGCAVLLVEQHVHMALEIADRALIMTQGRITLSGAAAELAERSDLVEASYLGAAALPDAG